MKQARRFVVPVAVFAALLMLGACNKKPVKTAPPPPPSPPAGPSASLSANPNSVAKGEATTLTWETTNANDVQIDGIGPVNTSGSRQVTPTDSITYRLVAKGAGGTQEATARVTVNTPPPPQTEAAPSATEEQMFNQSMKDIAFGYDSYAIGADQQANVQASAAFLKQHPGIHFSVEGHCDERGSTDYNLALGDNRANSVKSALVQAGVAADRIRTISWGKEKPFCSEHTEACWQQNRRGHFVYQK